MCHVGVSFRYAHVVVWIAVCLCRSVRFWIGNVCGQLLEGFDFVFE